jgi:hypothetical protein
MGIRLIFDSSDSAASIKMSSSGERLFVDAGAQVL